MKLKIGEKVYVQKYDVAFILHELHEFPADIYAEIFGEEGNRAFYINGVDDQYEFDQAFERPESAKWIMEQPWLMNFDHYKTLPVSELETIYDDMAKNCTQGIAEFNAQSEEYREEHFEEFDQKYCKDGHFIFSLGAMINYLKKEVKFTFPNEVDAEELEFIELSPTDLKKEPNFFKRLFSRRARQITGAFCGIIKA